MLYVCCLVIGCVVGVLATLVACRLAASAKCDGASAHVSRDAVVRGLSENFDRLLEAQNKLKAALSRERLLRHEAERQLAQARKEAAA